VAVDLSRARRVTNYVKGASNFSESTSEHKITVPTGKRYWIIAGVIGRDQAETLDVSLHNSSDGTLLYMADEAAGTGVINIPNTKNLGPAATGPIPADAGDYMKFAFGGAQGAAAEITLIVLEVSI